jgi:hypothetical protein
VVIDDEARDVQAWSTVRLPFEPRGWLVDFRRELAAACRSLVAGPGEVLHACYTAHDRARVDVENVLTYNLGTGAIGAAAANGVLLERAFGVVAGAGAHHYHYRLTPSGRWKHWSAGRLLGSVRLVAGPEVFAAGKAGRWWLAARRAGVDCRVPVVDVPEHITVRMTIAPPPGWRGSLAGLLKPLVDGLLSAMQAHDGPVEPLLDRASAIDPSLTADELQALLAGPRPAPLGRGTLLVPRATGVMWLPADDRVVALEVRRVADGPPGTVTAEVAEAQA